MISLILSNLKIGTFCLDKDSFIEIFGYWDEKLVKYFEIDLIKCVNDSTISNESVICKSDEEINDFISNHYVQMYVSNHNVDVSNYENPFHSYLKGFYYSLSTKFMKMPKLYMKKATLETDYGFLTKAIGIVNTYLWDKIEIDIFYVEP